MKCPHCGFTGSDEAATCRKCGGELAQARQALGLASPLRPHRATTPILDGPVDPSLIDDAPPAPEKPAATSILDLESEWHEALAEGAPGSTAHEEMNLDEILAGADPVEPADVCGAGGSPASATRAASPGAPVARSTAPAAPVAAGAAEEVIDLGEPVEIEERRATVPSFLRDLRDWPEEEWEGIEGDIRSTADPSALPKGGFWLRVVASMVDSIFIQIVSSIVVFAVASASGAMAVIASHLPAPGANAEAVRAFEDAMMPLLTGPLGWTLLALITLASLYRPVCHWRWGKTLGKKLVGLRVVTTQGERLSFARACWRDIAYLLASLPLGLGLLWVAWDPQKQGWHDKLAGTYVLKEST